MDRSELVFHNTAELVSGATSRVHFCVTDDALVSVRPADQRSPRERIRIGVVSSGGTCLTAAAFLTPIEALEIAESLQRAAEKAMSRNGRIVELPR